MKKLAFLKISLVLLFTLINVSVALNTSALADDKPQELKEVKDKELEEKKISYLLDKVEQSGATFIRNGDEHPAKKARKHLEHKMNMARKMFWFFGPSKPISARDFIDKIAAASSTTGKPYQIRTTDGKTYTTKEWLDRHLKEFQQSSQSP
jgi:hypothetical protein